MDDFRKIHEHIMRLVTFTILLDLPQLLAAARHLIATLGQPPAAPTPPGARPDAQLTLF